MKRNVHIALLACAIALAFTGCTKEANTQFTKRELDALEKDLQASENERGKESHVVESEFLRL